MADESASENKIEQSNNNLTEASNGFLDRWQNEIILGLRLMPLVIVSFRAGEAFASHNYGEAISNGIMAGVWSVHILALSHVASLKNQITELEDDNSLAVKNE